MLTTTAIMVSIAAWLIDIGWWTLVVWIGRIIGICFIPSVLLQRSTRPVSALAWILALIFLPYLGVLLWWGFGRNHLRRRSRQRVKARRTLSTSFESLETAAKPARPDGGDPTPIEDALSTRRLLVQDKHDLFPATQNNTAAFFPNTAAAFDAFEKAIEEATDHIHFQYYIWKSDETGTRFRDLLIKKARQGVEVRILYDAVGSVSIRKRFIDPATEAGAEVAPFLPVRLWERRLRVNFRNHRKLLIVDGRCGFTGGVNIADEYLEWFDTACGFEGPVVHQMQEVFIGDWYFATGKDIADRRYFPDLEHRQGRHHCPDASPQDRSPHYLLEPQGPDVDARIVASGPDDPFDTIHKTFFLAATSARDHLFIITPYFVPDTALVTALQTAAMRGVDVRIIVPAQTDVPLTQHAGRTFWEPVLEAGVRIFEYQRQILHAKLLVLDDTHVFAGSANMDIRSFQLNFEANAIIRNQPFNKQMTDFFFDTLDKSREVDLHDFRNRPRKTRLKEGIARLFSPLL